MPLGPDYPPRLDLHLDNLSFLWPGALPSPSVFSWPIVFAVAMQAQWNLRFLVWAKLFPHDVSRPELSWLAGPCSGLVVGPKLASNVASP